MTETIEAVMKRYAEEAARSKASSMSEQSICQLMSDAYAIADHACKVLPKLVEALEAAQSHLEELRDAWMRGAIRETDNLGGTRSNRNADVEVACRDALALVRGTHDYQH